MADRRTRLPLVFLPGLDGTGDLAAPFEAVAGPLQVIEYEPSAPTTYEELVPWVAARLPTHPFLLIAESFSAPIALALAASPPPSLLGAVISNGVSRVRGRRLFRLLPWGGLLRLPKPDFLVRALFAGRSASPALCALARGAINAAPRRRLSARVRAVLGCDTRPMVPRARVPLLCLHGAQDRLVLLGLRRVRAADRSATRVAGPHMLLQARPDVCWPIIEAFKAEVLAGGRTSD